MTHREYVQRTTARKDMLAIITSALIAGACITQVPAPTPSPQLTCATDSECMEPCPADDDECDGSPEPGYHLLPRPEIRRYVR